MSPRAARAAALWTREAVSELIRQQWGVKLFQKAVGNYLRPWGLWPQKPAQRSREQSPEAVKYWMEKQYPTQPCTDGRNGKDSQSTRRHGAALRPSNRYLLGTQGTNPGRRTSGQCFGCNLLSTLTKRGTLRFQVLEERFTTEAFLDFLRRLVPSVLGKVFFLVDRRPSSSSWYELTCTESSNGRSNSAMAFGHPQ
ncbi:MAG: hypothetical protein BRC48_05655 [Cyanobacteria bacterium QS_9_48_30]|nr:MAG: hypothetical protein BRC48_05655 [Cyanobacteria bacterium QS_9_48_30]